MKIAQNGKDDSKIEWRKRWFFQLYDKKRKKVKKSILQLAMEHILDGKYAGLSSILEPYELGLE